MIRYLENEENANNANLMKHLLMNQQSSNNEPNEEQINNKDNEQNKPVKIFENPIELFDFAVNDSLSISSFESAQNSTSILRHDYD